MDETCPAMPMVEALREIAGRRFTSEAYTKALVARIALREKEVRAWAWFDGARAIEAARRTDRKFQPGDPPSPLQGIPVGLKDIFDTEGIPTEMGSLAFAGHVPLRSAKLVHRLESLGAFVMGKTVTAECAFLSPGPTRNPWNPRHTPGGSSSGSAAAVAAGFIPAAIGTQTNGSVIRPAAFCGIVGFKPTRGAISIEGALVFSHTLDQVGVFTRNVEDAARLASALADDGSSIPYPVRAARTPPRLAVVQTPAWERSEAHMQDHFRKCAGELEKAGAHVVPRELPEEFRYAHAALRTIMSVEGWSHLGALHRQKGELLSTTLRDFLIEGRNTATAVYEKAMKTREDLRERFNRYFSEFDAVITLPTAGEAPETLSHTGDPSFCTIWSLCGVPALTIPSGFGPRGLPLGLQLVSRKNDDGGLLSAALWCEAALGKERLFLPPEPDERRRQPVSGVPHFPGANNASTSGS